MNNTEKERIHGQFFWLRTITKTKEQYKDRKIDIVSIFGGEQ